MFCSIKNETNQTLITVFKQLSTVNGIIFGETRKTWSSFSLHWRGAFSNSWDFFTIFSRGPGVEWVQPGIQFCIISGIRDGTEIELRDPLSRWNPRLFFKYLVKRWICPFWRNPFSNLLRVYKNLIYNILCFGYILYALQPNLRHFLENRDTILGSKNRIPRPVPCF